MKVSEEDGFLSRSAPLFTPSLQAQTFALIESIRCQLEELSCSLPERKYSGRIGESVPDIGGHKVLGLDWRIYPRQLLEQKVFSVDWKIYPDAATVQGRSAQRRSVLEDQSRSGAGFKRRRFRKKSWSQNRNSFLWANIVVGKQQ